MDHKVSKDMISSGMIPSGEKTQADLGRTQYGSTPSPSRLMDAYKSMYKEENLDEMTGGTPKITRLKPDLKAQADAVHDSQFSDDFDRTAASGVKDSPEAKKIKQDKIKKGRESFRTGQKQENVDLLSAYRAVYEHHKKDADGNTIPHEDEEVNEGKIPAGLQAYLDKKKGKKEDKKEMKEGLATAAKRAFSAVKNVVTKNKGQLVRDVARGAATQFGAQAVSSMMNSGGGQQKSKTGTASATQYASADLFDIVKGQLLDEGLSEEEIRDIMLTLTPDEILKEIEESSMSAGSAGGHYHDGGDGVFRSKEQIGNMFNKNIPTKKQTGGKVDKMTRKSINTSARELGIQGPTTLKQSVEPEGETI